MLCLASLNEPTCLASYCKSGKKKVIYIEVLPTDQKYTAAMTIFLALCSIGVSDSDSDRMAR